MSLDKIIKSGIFGMVLGIIAGLGISTPSDEARIFRREEGKPAVMRVYKPGRDEIFVENNSKYIPMKEYLESIPDKSDREIEKAEIKKVVEWYK